jgi:hypothetical protein
MIRQGFGATSVDLQNKLWQQAIAMTAAAPQSLPADLLVASFKRIETTSTNGV